MKLTRTITIDKTKRRQYSPRCTGISYVEILAAAVIMSVLMVASMRLFGNLGRSRQHTIDRDAASQLVIDMIEEIRQKPYRDPDDDGEFGPGEDEDEGTSRSLFDDIDDYDEWTSNPPQTADGRPLSQFARLTRSVSVQYVSAADFTPSDDEGFLEVTITVSTPDREIERQVYVIADIDSLKGF